MAIISFNLNGKEVAVDADPSTPLLWVLREQIGLTGPKYSCGIAMCGACAVHIDGDATPSCTTLLESVKGHKVITIEGLSEDGSHPLQKAWVEEQVPQCGYCQSGMIMSTLALLQQRPDPTNADIDAAVTNACRCATYHRVRQAIHLAADLMKA